MRILAWATLLLLLAAGCLDPSDPAGWAARAASRTRTQEKLEALAQVRKAPGDKKAAVPYLLLVLKQAPRVRAEAALALGEIGDPASVPGMVAAIDPAAADRDGFEANRRLAEALGAMKAREAVPLLVKLCASTDAYTQVAAVDALGSIGDPAAEETLARVAASPGVEPVTVQHALLALGQIGDARAVPTVLRLLFVERSGASFFPQASFAAAQLGRPMAARLEALLAGKDGEMEAWAKENHVVQGALYAKAAQLLGEMGGPAAVPSLVSRLGYADPDESVAMLVHVFAAESLGRLGAKEAVKPLSDLLARETDPDARDRYCDALSRIGDPAGLPALRALAAKGDWAMRVGPLTALSRMGGAPEAALLAGVLSECGAGCPKDRATALAGMQARLLAAGACSDDARCWAGKLEDPRAEVRDRAALEVGRRGGPADAPLLARAILRPVEVDPDLSARYHAVLALSWIMGRSPLSAEGQQIAGQLEAMIAAERGRRLTEGVNEDALRLAARLRRGT